MLKRPLAIMICLTLVATLGSNAQPAQASLPVAPSPTITVNTLDDELNSDGDCSLREAITAANTNVAVDACPAGIPGADTIFFGVTGIITLTSSLPNIADALTIDGPGAASLTISGNNAVAVFTVNAGKTFNLRKVTIANGRGLDGAGIFNASGGTVDLIDSTLSGNVAEGWGGGIFNFGAFTVTRSSLIGNRSVHSFLSYGGGGIANRGTLNVIDSTLTGNVADCFGCPGGGIYNMSGTVTILNSTFSGNVARTGGGVFNQPNATVTIIYSTFFDNQGPLGGNNLGTYGVMTLRNSIIANDLLAENCFANPFYIFDIGHNLQFPDASCGNTIPIANPQLGPLQDNGGSTFTHALLAGSPAIDAVPLAACPFAAADQRGIPRPQGAACDSGAVEMRGFTLAKAGGDQQTAIINTAFAQPLSVTLTETGGAGLGGVTITFTAPTRGVSIAPPTTVTQTTNARGMAAVSVTANSLGGSYVITATASSLSTSLAFSLTNTYVITPIASVNGSITPSTPQMVSYGDTITFTITPDTGYYIVDVGVDGVSYGPLPSYTFGNVTANHTITAAFATWPMYLPLILRNDANSLRRVYLPLVLKN